MDAEVPHDLEPSARVVSTMYGKHSERSMTDGRGRSLIAVIGINQYATWPELKNAVPDALGVLAVFQQLGFEPVAPLLLDAAATADAIRSLVVDTLRTTLNAADSLVVFFAGHGHAQETLIGRQRIKLGYVLPADAARPGEQIATWIDLDSWLRDIARLPARHILVILDACNSGIALGPMIRWRDVGTGSEPPDALGARISRRIITSALDDQRAMDGGPYPDHSLFTGCLIAALRYELALKGHRTVTGSQLALHVQERVRKYPSSPQTPDFGVLDFDDRGEIMVRTLAETPPPVPDPPIPPPPRSLRIWRWIAAAAAVVLTGAMATWSQVQDTSLRHRVESTNAFIDRNGQRIQAHEVSDREYLWFIDSIPAHERAAKQQPPIDPSRVTDGPVTGVTAADAAQFCSAISSRLPTAAEWQTASRGDWGIEIDNTHELGPNKEWVSDIDDSGYVSACGASQGMSREGKTKLVKAGNLTQYRANTTDKSVGFRCVPQ